MFYRNYIPIAVMVAAIFWMTESLIHFTAGSDERFEVIPTDLNEFCMRTFIVVLIIGFGFYVDYLTKRHIAELEKRKDQYKETIKETREQFIEFLVESENFELVARKLEGMDKEALNRYQDKISAIKKQLMKLESAGDITAQYKISSFRTDTGKN